MDLWKDEYLPRLNQSLLYENLKIKCGDKDNEVLSLVDEVVSYACQRTKSIIKHMGEFTLHDSDHLFRVLFIMEKLITEDKIKNLSSPEAMLLILSAFLHDIGMAPNVKHVKTWKKFWDESPSFNDLIEEEEYNKFKRFCDTRHDQLQTIERFIKQGNISHADTLKGYLISEYIRRSHSERSRDIIDEDFNKKIRFRDTDLTVELAQICFSHNQDALSLLELEKDYLCDGEQIACLPLVGVLLRLADILDFDGSRTPSVLFSHLFVTNPVSIKEWQKHRAIKAMKVRPDLIQFHAQCSHPAIEASIHDFCDIIDQELLACNNVLTEVNEFNKSRDRDISLKITRRVDRSKIQTKKTIKNEPIYQFKKTRFTLSKKNIIELLMGTKLYGNPEVAIRELIQNSIDACLLRSAQEKAWGNNYTPEITVKYFSNGEDDILEVLDNGTGMDQDIIDNYYSQIGSSFYKSSDFLELKSKSKADFIPTSRFGIGILSCFMVSDKMIVNTRRVYGPHDSSDPIEVIIEGEESIFWTKKGQRKKPGTTTRLLLRKKEHPWDRMDEDEFIESVKTVIPNPPCKISIETDKKTNSIDENSFTTVKAETLKKYSWEENNYIKSIEIELNNEEDSGIKGTAFIAILEHKGKPVERVEITSREIEIDGDFFNLEKNLSLNDEEIKESSNSITIDEDGTINKENYSRSVVESKSSISLHGIEIPTTLFPSTWRMKKNQAKLDWPIPMLLVVDISGKRDLDLNSARTEINKTEKWVSFEQELSYLVCKGLQKKLKPDYWKQLFDVLKNSTKNENFLRGLERLK